MGAYFLGPLEGRRRLGSSQVGALAGPALPLAYFRASAWLLWACPALPGAVGGFVQIGISRSVSLRSKRMVVIVFGLVRRFVIRQVV